MARQVLWLLFDVAAGVLAAGLLAPVTVAVLPEAYRGRVALAVVAVLAVTVVSLLRRALGFGSAGPSR